MACNLNFEHEGFKNIILRHEQDLICLRTNVMCEEDWRRWKEEFCRSNNTTLNCRTIIRRMKKMVFKQVLICLHGDKRHQGRRKTFTGCGFKVDIRIKLITKSTKSDQHVQQYPCFVAIKGSHNHATASGSALQENRVLSSTKNYFFKYFGQGLTAAQALRLHHEKLELGLFDAANIAINPTSSCVYYMRDRWLRKRHEAIGGDCMFSTMKKYAAENQNTRIELQVEDDRLTAVLVSDFMLRIHKEFKEASEVVFVDTTHRKDKLKTSVTALFCAGPAGAFPLGIIFTSTQDVADYTTGFQLLKKVLDKSGFCGQGYPECFITDDSKAIQTALRTSWPKSSLFISISYTLKQVWRWMCDSSSGIKKEQHSKLNMTAKELVNAESEPVLIECWNRFCNTPEAILHKRYTSYLSKLVERRQEWGIGHGAWTLVRGHQKNNYAEYAIHMLKNVILNRCKAYNCSQLIFFLNEVYDLHMKQQLLNVALHRDQVKSITKCSIPPSDVKEENDHMFTVKSQSIPGMVYPVDMDISICGCSSGQTSICKHQTACAEHYLMRLPQMFQGTAVQRQWLAGVAVGEKELPRLEISFNLQESPFSDCAIMHSTVPPENVVNCENYLKCKCKNVNKHGNVIMEASTSSSNKNANIKICHELLDKIVSHYSDDLTVVALAGFMKRLRSVNSSKQLNGFFLSVQDT